MENVTDVDSYCNCKVVYQRLKYNTAMLVETSAIKRVSCKHTYIVITVDTAYIHA